MRVRLPLSLSYSLSLSPNPLESLASPDLCVCASCNEVVLHMWPEAKCPLCRELVSSSLRIYQ